MPVIRLVVLAVLAYIAWLLIRGITGGSRTKGRVSGGKGSTAKTAHAQDVLVEDPICHRLVPRHQAVRFRRDGITYYFCSDDCCDKFSESARGEE